MQTLKSDSIKELVISSHGLFLDQASSMVTNSHTEKIHLSTASHRNDSVKSVARKQYEYQANISNAISSPKIVF